MVSGIDLSIKDKEFVIKVNPETVVWQGLETDYWKNLLKGLVEEHFNETGSDLSKKIIESIKRVNFKGKLIFASSILEDTDIAYGQAKREARELLYNASIKNNFSFYGLIIPNVFSFLSFFKKKHNI